MADKRELRFREWSHARTERSISKAYRVFELSHATDPAVGA